MSTEFDKEEKTILRAMIQVLEIAREIDKDMQLQFLHTLLSVGVNDGAKMSDLQTKLHLSSSAMTRNVQYWAQFRTGGAPGQDMMENYIDPADQRQKSVRLKAKGRALVRELIASMRRILNGR